ncbi:MAG: aspartyl protease family protein [Acidobacteriota bacterium]
MNTEVDFRLAGGQQPLILLPTFVNKKGPYQFILDTGAGTSLLAPQLAENLGVAITETKEGTGAGGKLKVSLGNVESLAIGDAELNNVQVAITDDINRIATAIGAKVDGDIGYNYLKFFQLTIDYQTHILRLTADPVKQSSSVRREIKFKLAKIGKPLIVVAATVNGKGPYQFAVDTGASTTVISLELAESLALQSQAMPAMIGAGGTVQTSVSAIESLTIGDIEVNHLTVMISDFLSMLSQAIATKIDGIVGYNYLKAFRVTIDYPNEVIRLE